MLRESISNILIHQLQKSISGKIEEGMNALHTEDGWTEGSFETTKFQKPVTISVEAQGTTPQGEPSQAKFVVAKTDDEESREWPIPTNEFEDGLDSAVYAVHDALFRE